MRPGRLSSLLPLLAACGPRAAVSEPEAAAPARVVAPAPPPSAVTASGAPAAATPDPAEGTARAAETVAATPSFPPRSVTPPHARTAAALDGEWTPLGDPARKERAATTPPIVVKTVLHPHPENRWVTVTLGAVDLTRTRAHLVLGTEDLVWAKKKPGPESGLVPPEHRGQLAVVMNGGFQPKHGRWGLVAQGLTIAPPKPGGCTIGLDADGGVALGPWEALSPAADRFQSIRQTVPCLVQDGAVHPWLLSGRDAAWKGQVADITTRRRSAIGVDRDGKVLYFAMGEEATARWLAEGLLLAGAHASAQLDINWYWTRFLLFGEGDDGTLRVTSTLVPKMEHQATGYVQRPSTRDFFYVTLR